MPQAFLIYIETSASQSNVDIVPSQQQQQHQYHPIEYKSCACDVHILLTTIHTQIFYRINQCALFADLMLFEFIYSRFK